MLPWAFILVAIFVVVAVAAARRHRNLFQNRDYRWTAEQSDSGTDPARAREADHGPDRLGIRPLNERDRQAFLKVWTCVRQRFQSDPKTAVVYADLLMSDLIENHARHAAWRPEKSLDGSLRQKFLSAHDVAIRNQQGHVTLDELRRAFDLYGALFDELVRARSASRPKQLHEDSERMHHHWA